MHDACGQSNGAGLLPGCFFVALRLTQIECFCAAFLFTEIIRLSRQQKKKSAGLHSFCMVQEAFASRCIWEFPATTFRVSVISTILEP